MKTIIISDVLDRLKQALNITTDTQLADALKVGKATISNWRSRNTVDFSLLFSNCGQTNINWLLNGEGDMATNSKISSPLLSDKTRPRIPLDAAAGALSLMSQDISEAECEKRPLIPCFPDYDFTIMVKGNSMEPEFHSGDELACRFIDKPSFIQWGRPHVLDTYQGVVLKRIYDRRNSILCKSDNKDYEDFEIPKEEILRIALVVGSIRLY